MIHFYDESQSYNYKTFVYVKQTCLCLGLLIVYKKCFFFLRQSVLLMKQKIFLNIHYIEILVKFFLPDVMT